MKKKNNIIIVSSIVVLLLALYAKTMTGNSSHIYENLQGYHTFDMKFIEILRQGEIYNVSSLTQIKGHKIELDVGVINLNKGKYKDYGRETDAERYGKWKVISNNPDSIEIEDPKSFFSGRYSIDFGIAYGFPPRYAEDTLWTVLENDSTHLVFYRLSKKESEIKKWLK